MIVNLFELLQKENSSKNLNIKYEESTFSTGLNNYPVKDSSIDIKLHNDGNKHISCTCKGYVILSIPCDKCLEDVDTKIDIDYFKDLDMNKTSAEKEAELDEEFFIKDMDFDTEILIHNEILVNLPMKVLCRIDCKGICNRCGANLNMGSCNCDVAELDPRMSKILDVFNQFKEV